MSEHEGASQTFRALVESADRKFARVRDVTAYGRVRDEQRYFQKVFKAYMKLWKFQQANRTKLVASGLNRWEIGEIASRIGQLYFGQYLRTSEVRFLLEASIFYDAILSRNYFSASAKDLAVRFKELRFYARFLLVSFVLNRTDTVRLLLERFRALVDETRASFRDTNFKEWRQVLQEITRFMKVDTAFMNMRPLRYCATYDSHQDSRPYLARFHANKVLKFQDALLTSYHRNEVKFAELTLDTFRMLQCLEWEPTGSFFQKRPIEIKENGISTDYSGPSGLTDINLAADLTDPTLPPNPRKAILYRPSVTHLIAVMATICEELPPDSVMLVHLSASGTVDRSGLHAECSGESHMFSRNKAVSAHKHNNNNTEPKLRENDNIVGGDNSNPFYDKCLYLGPRGNCGPNNLYPGDILPFTRRPLFLIIDSDTSRAFKVLHGAERGEPCALLLSPLRSTYKNSYDSDISRYGSQFTFFLTAPIAAFCQLVGLSFSGTEADVYNDGEKILLTSFTEWEVILSTSRNLDLVWAQVLSDPFLRRLILRFIFCRSVFSLLSPPEDHELRLPLCLPSLPDTVSPESDAVRSAVFQLAKHLGVTDFFRPDATSSKLSS